MKAVHELCSYSLNLSYIQLPLISVTRSCSSMENLNVLGVTMLEGSVGQSAMSRHVNTTCTASINPP